MMRTRDLAWWALLIGGTLTALPVVAFGYKHGTGADMSEHRTPPIYRNDTVRAPAAHLSPYRSM